MANGRGRDGVGSGGTSESPSFIAANVGLYVELSWAFVMAGAVEVSSGAMTRMQRKSVDILEDGGAVSDQLDRTPGGSIFIDSALALRRLSATGLDVTSELDIEPFKLPL